MASRALGWRGSALHWARWLQAYRVLALLGVLQAVCTQTRRIRDVCRNGWNLAGTTRCCRPSSSSTQHSPVWAWWPLS